MIKGLQTDATDSGVSVGLLVLTQAGGVAEDTAAFWAHWEGTAFLGGHCGPALLCDGGQLKPRPCSCSHAWVQFPRTSQTPLQQQGVGKLTIRMAPCPSIPACTARSMPAACSAGHFRLHSRSSAQHVSERTAPGRLRHCVSDGWCGFCGSNRTARRPASPVPISMRLAATGAICTLRSRIRQHDKQIS